jgi:hypothetical protein
VNTHAGHELQSLFLAAVVIGAAGVVIGLGLLERRGLLGEQDREVPLGRTLTVIAAALSLGAAAIHYSVIGVHAEEWWAYGLFFVGVAWFQTLWAVVIVNRPSPSLLAVGALVNLGVAFLWVWTRVAGLPAGPQAGVVEPVGVLDTLSFAFELGVVAATWLALRPASSPQQTSVFNALTAQAMAVVLVAAATSVVLALPGGHEHAATEAAEPAHTHDASHTHAPGEEHGETPTLPPATDPPAPAASILPAAAPTAVPSASPTPHPSHTH